MPVYGSAAPLWLKPGTPTPAWTNETVTVGTASLAVQVNREAVAAAVLSVEVKFAATPGAFQVDLQTADTDAEAYYVTKASLDEGLNATFCGRIEATNIVAQYVRLKLVARASAVAVTATFCQGEDAMSGTVLTVEERYALTGPVLSVPPATGAVLSLPVVGEASPASPLLTNLVSYWKLDEASGTRADSHGTNHLTPSNAPVGAAGKIGQGCDFESSSGQMLSHPDADPLGNESFTYALWFKRETIGAQRNASLRKMTTHTARCYHVYLSDGTGLTFYWAYRGFTTRRVATIPDDLNWHFVLFWTDATADTVNISG